MQVMIVVAILTLAAGGLGAGVGWQFLELRRPAAASAPEPVVVAKEEAGVLTRFPKDAVVRPLPPILTNLAGTTPAWIRLEAALVMAADNAESRTLAAELGEDLVAFLRTLEPRQIQGASGFQHLRDELDDRARIRSKGKSLGLIIQALVVE